MPNKKDYKNLPDDGELLYMLSDNNDETKLVLAKKYKPVITYYANKYSVYVEGKGIDFNDLYYDTKRLDISRHRNCRRSSLNRCLHCKIHYV